MGVSYMSNTSCVYVPNGGVSDAKTSFYRLTTQFEIGDHPVWFVPKERVLSMLRANAPVVFHAEGLPS